MATNTPVNPVRPAEFEQFTLWYAARRLRKSGRPASPSTLRTRAGHLATCANVAGCPDQVSLGILIANRDRVEYLLDGLAARMSPGAMRSVVYSLMAFADYAKAAGLASASEVRSADIPPPNPLPAIRVYSDAEIEQFVSSARGRDLRWWAFMAFIADTGRRVGEVLSLRWEWFRLEDWPAYVELPFNKSARPQYIPLSTRLTTTVFTDEVILKLMHEKRTGQRAFRRSPLEHPFPWAYATVNLRFRYFCDATGLPNRGFHTFRHSLITERLARGVPIQAVASLAGHSSVSVTDRRYNHTHALNYAEYVDKPQQTPRI